MLSIAIPYHGDRTEYVAPMIDGLKGAPGIMEIVVNDDASRVEEYEKLKREVGKKPLVRISKNSMRQFVFRNKVATVKLCKSPWVALIDSDNIITYDYIKKFMEQDRHTDTIYAPEKGLPRLDYSNFVGAEINRKTAPGMMAIPKFDMLLNTMNYVFHRETWLRAIGDPQYEPGTADSMYINCLCFRAGMRMEIVKGMEYVHTVHPKSTFVVYHKRYNREHAKVKGMINDI